MSTVKSKKLQVGTDASASNNFTIYQPATPDGTLRIGVGNADSPTEVGRFNSSGYVATNAPAFRAYNAGTQSITASTNTKVIFNSEDFDTANCFDSTTNYRFTPNVAGYYQFNCGVYFQASNNSFIYLVKNNSLITSRFGGIQSGYGMFVGSDIIYANGTTDYFEVYAHNGSNVTIGAGDDSLMNFSAFLVKAT